LLIKTYEKSKSRTLTMLLLFII